MYEENYPRKRYKLTLDFINKYISKDDVILDLGVDNPLSKLLKLKGYNVSNTNGEDLDTDFKAVEKNNADVICAFQILEHLVSPYNILNRTKAKKLMTRLRIFNSQNHSHQAQNPIEVDVSNFYSNPQFNNEFIKLN